jgi:Peptidase propeptide and YPEB domain
VTGETALGRMFQVARSWDPRIQVLKLTSAHLSEVPEVPGKAASWEGTFVSPTQGRTRTYTFSVIELLPNLHKGVFSVAEEPFSGSKGTSTPFLIEAVKTDTDKAYETALTKAGDYDKKNPGKPITLILELTPRHPDPTWRVVWGDSVGSSNFSVFIDATTGQFLEVMH